MTSILVIHGRSRPLFGPAEMKQQWLVALRSGFEAAGLAVPFTDEDVRLPWYGNNLTRLVDGQARAEAERVSLRGDMPSDERAFILDVVTQVHDAYGFTAEQLESVAAPEDAAAPRGEWGWLRNVLAAVDAYLPGMSGATVAFVARESFGYLTDSPLRQVIDDGVIAAARANEPIVVVGHSLGALIAYHVLRTHPEAVDWDVPLLLTLGAPLGWNAVTTAAGRLATLRTPKPVARWVNGRDPLDAVALGGIAPGLLPPSSAVLDEPRIENGADGRHAIEYYLADPLVAAFIADAL